MTQNETLRNAFMTSAGRTAVRNGEVRVRDPKALQSLLAKADQAGNAWGIVSVSWSRRFILGVLLEACLVNEEQAKDVAKKIRCNELLAPHQIDGEDRLDIICSAQDKQNAFHDLLAEWMAAHSLDFNDIDTVITIYVGDSSTDIGCLAGANVGIYMQATSELEDDSVIQTLRRLGIECLSSSQLEALNTPAKLLKLVAKQQNENQPPHIVCVVRSFQEIDTWVAKLLESPD